MAQWSKQHDPYIHDYAAWLKSVVQQYYGLGYGPGGGPQIPNYRDMLQGVSSSYHSLGLCNYGFNGNDDGAREDLRAQAAEERAGLE